MKITNIEYRKLRIELPEVFKVAFMEITHSENVFVKIITNEGIIGYGEAAPLTFVTGETIDTVAAIIDLLKPILIGRSPLAIDQIHTIMDQTIIGNSSARCAIDLALYDIRGKVMGKPVYELMGGGDGIVQNDMTVGIGAPEMMAEKAKHYVNDLGIRILKIKVGINPQEDIRALKLIREAVGKDIRIRVDANQGYSVSDAISIFKPFRELGVESIEQCLPYWDFDGAKFLRGKAKGIKLMLDESIHTPKDAARACKLEAADILNIKLMKCGGLYKAEQISAVADSFGLTCMVGCMLETRLALTAGLSLVAAKNNVTDADCDSFRHFDEEDTGVSGGFTYEGDMFRLSDKPGFGVDVDF